MTLKKHPLCDPPTTAHLSSRLRMGSMNDQSGLALPTALAFVVVTGVLIGTALLVGTMQRKLSSDSMRTIQAQYAASAGIEKAAQETFVKVLKNLKSGRTLIDYRKELDKIVLDGKKQEFEGTTLDKKESYKAIVEREDTAHSTILKITSRGWQMDKNTQYAKSPKDATTRVLQQNLIIAPDQNVQGAAIFANEASCTACHTKVMDMKTFWTSSGGNTPSFLDGKPIAKVVVTGDLTLFQNGPFITSPSTDEADLTVAGTLYLGGDVKDQNLLPTPAPDLSNDKVVSFVERTGNSTLGSNVKSPVATECSLGCPSGQSMYWKYPLGNSKAADGSFPASPPLPFADGNHNKTIEGTEWTSITASEPGGTLSGGNNDIYPLSVWSDGADTRSGRKYKDSMGTDKDIMVYNSPTVAFSTKKPLKPAQIVNGVISGSVVLDGTKSPIDISGTVFVNGDVVIFGKTSGQGKIFARGNVYVMGDLEYDCGGSCDYTKADTDKDFPMLTLAAGKNIILGDVFARAGAYNNSQELGQPNSVEPSYKSITAGIPDWLEAYGKLAPDTHGPYRDAEGDDLGQPPALWDARKNQFETDHKPLDVDTIMRKATFCASMQDTITNPNGLCNWPTVGTRTVRIRSVTGAEFGSFPFTFTPATPFACSIEENNVGRNASIPMGTPLDDIFCTVDTRAVQMNFAAAQLAKFNQIEDDKTSPTYLPVHYSLYAGDPPVRSAAKTENYLQYDMNPDPLANPKGIQPLGSVGTQTSLSPTGGWLTASDLRGIWNQNMETTARRRAEDEMYPIRAKAFQIDAVLHAAHAVVGFTRGNSRIEATATNPEAKFVEWGGRSSTGGRVMIQGAVVAQDIGILAPGDARDGGKDGKTTNRGRKSITKANTIRDDWYGLRINYDARAAKLFVDPNTGFIKQLRRSGSRLVEF